MPRVKPTWLSPGWRPPYFAPVTIRPMGFLVWNGTRFDWPLNGWVDAVVDEASLSINWSDVVPFGEITVRWNLAQTYDATVGQNLLTSQVIDQDFAEQRSFKFSGERLSAWEDATNTAAGWTELRRDLPPWQFWTPMYDGKPWR